MASQKPVEGSVSQ